MLLFRETVPSYTHTLQMCLCIFVSVFVFASMYVFLIHQLSPIGVALKDARSSHIQIYTLYLIAQ